MCSSPSRRWTRSQVATAPICKVDGEKVGTVRLWVYGSEALDASARSGVPRQFLPGHVALPAGVAIVLASCIGFLFAAQLWCRRSTACTKTARAIGDGDLVGSHRHLTGEDEVARLGETFDVMAESVEKDRDLERRLTTDVAHELRTPAHGHPGHGGGHDRWRVRGRRGAPESPVNSEIQRLCAAGERPSEAVALGKPRRRP